MTVPYDAGISTVSTTWITPLDWLTFAIVTVEEPPLASTIITLSPECFTVSSSPSTVFSFLPSVRLEASSLPGTTWYVRILVSVGLLSGFTSVSTVPAGSLPKAALVGANTVNGPFPSSVSTRPAAFTAATRVVWSLELTAFWMMFLEGNIAAPPTITVFSPDNSLFIIFLSSAVAGAITLAEMASAEKATADNSANRLDMETSPEWNEGRRTSAGDGDGAATASSLAELREVIARVSEKLFRVW